MALVRPGFGPGPQSGGAQPPTPPSWIGGSGHPMPDPGGPAWRPPTGMPTMPGNLGAGAGHPASFYTTPAGAGGTPGAGAGWTITGTHPALHHILNDGTTADGWHPGAGPPPWWPTGATWPPPGGRNWFGPPPSTQPPTPMPPVGPPAPPHWMGGPPNVVPPLLASLLGLYNNS